jgi:ankyrin repeat protein
LVEFEVAADYADRFGKPPLPLACMNRELDIANQLIEGGANASCKTSEG